MTGHAHKKGFTMSATKTAARRWLADHVGRDVDTVTRKGDQVVWTPGPRPLSTDRGRFFMGRAVERTLSEVRVSVEHQVIEVTPTKMVLRFGEHDTTYEVTDDIPEPEARGFFSECGGCSAELEMSHHQWHFATFLPCPICKMGADLEHGRRNAGGPCFFCEEKEVERSS